MSANTTWRDWSCAVTVTVTDPARIDAAAAIVRDVMASVEASVSRFTDSELERVNDRAGFLVPVGRLTFDLVTLALRIAEETDGAVDPTVGADLIALGYDSDIAAVRRRSPERCAAILSGEPFRAPVAVDERLRRIGVPTGIRLDLGASAKAWAADEAARRISRQLGCGTLVGLGGDLASAGPLPRDWNIDIAEQESGESVRVGLHHGGLATSSTLARRWRTATGEEHHHIVDPRTGRPVDGPWRSASVWAPSAVEANTISTWMLVEPTEALRAVRVRGLSARLVSRTGTVTTIGGWPEARVAS